MLCLHGVANPSQLQSLYQIAEWRTITQYRDRPCLFPSTLSTHYDRAEDGNHPYRREIGFRICCGGIIGMGETMEERIEMACFLQKEGVLSIPLNLLQPIPGTPMENTHILEEEEWLTTIALFRLINPNAFLRFSGGRAQLSEATQREIPIYRD